MIELLKKVRNDKGLSQRAFAKMIGTSQPFISCYENCEIRLDIVDYYELAKLLDVSDDDIIKILRTNRRKGAILSTIFKAPLNEED